MNDKSVIRCGRYMARILEPDPHTHPVEVKRYRGIAVLVIGPQVEADENTEWSGCYNDTEYLVARMVGDDHHFLIEPSDILRTLTGEDYCEGCGQLGCTHNARPGLLPEDDPDDDGSADRPANGDDL